MLQNPRRNPYGPIGVYAENFVKDLVISTDLYLSAYIYYITVHRVCQQIRSRRLRLFNKSYLDIQLQKVYNSTTYGAAMVSTGILRYDKRGGLG